MLELGVGQENMISSKGLECATDFMLILSGDLFLDRPSLTLVSPAYSSVVCSFRAVRFQAIRMSLVSGIEHQEEQALSFACRSQKKCVWIAIIFVAGCFYLCGANF